MARPLAVPGGRRFMSGMLKVDIVMTDTVTGEVRRWAEDDRYDAAAFGEDGWADYMWSDGSSGHGQNRAMFFASHGDGQEVPNCDDDRFHVRIVDRVSGQTLYQDWKERGP